MKKFGPVIVLVLALLSCDPKYYTVTVENQSTKSVTYEYNGVKTVDLVPGDSREYRVEAFAPPPSGISVAGAVSVEMESRGSGERYVFKDRKSLTLEVENKLSVDVYLVADKYIDVSGSTPSLPLTTLEVKYDSTHNPAKIYTETPQFTVLATPSSLFYPAPSISQNIENGVMKVVITAAP